MNDLTTTREMFSHQLEHVSEIFTQIQDEFGQMAFKMTSMKQQLDRLGQLGARLLESSSQPLDMILPARSPIIHMEPPVEASVSTENIVSELIAEITERVLTAICEQEADESEKILENLIISNDFDDDEDEQRMETTLAVLTPESNQHENDQQFNSSNSSGLFVSSSEPSQRPTRKLLKSHETTIEQDTEDAERRLQSIMDYLGVSTDDEDDKRAIELESSTSCSSVLSGLRRSSRLSKPKLSVDEMLKKHGIGSCWVKVARMSPLDVRKAQISLKKRSKPDSDDDDDYEDRQINRLMNLNSIYNPKQKSKTPRNAERESKKPLTRLRRKKSDELDELSIFPDEDSSSNDVGRFGLQLKAIEDEFEPTSSSSGEERLMAMIDDDSDDDDDDGSMISADETLCDEDEERVEKKRVHKSEKPSKKTYEVICPELTMRGMFGAADSTGEGRTQKHAPNTEKSLGN